MIWDVNSDLERTIIGIILKYIQYLSFSIKEIMSMPAESMSREALLLKIKATEKDAIRTEEAAKARAAQIRANSQKEASRIIESSEDEGRKLLRSQLESARQEFEIARKEKIRVAQEKGSQLQSEVEIRIPEITELIFKAFKISLTAAKSSA